MSPADPRVARSVLFVDFDNMGLSIKKTDETLANAFARAPQVWVEALERGELIDDDGLLAPRRRFLMKRCYANPRLIDPYRANFTWAGFQVVDCPPLTGGGKNSADIYMVMDILDALEHKTPFDEFFILSSDADFTPVLTRLTAYDRRTVIFANQVTAQAYKTMCDGLIPEPALMDLLARTVEFARRERSRQAAPPPYQAAPTPTQSQPVEPRAAEPDTARQANGAETETPAANRPRVPQIPERVRRMARAIAEETDVPYLAPVVYAEMFKAIAEEVTENGFTLINRTVKGVHERIETANGWAIYPKYIAFVLKGIHFSGIDLTAGPVDAVVLAKAFQRQVIRLANKSGLNLQADDRKNVAWWMRSALPRVAAPAGSETDGADIDDKATAPIDDAEPLVDARADGDADGSTADGHDAASTAAEATRTAPPIGDEADDLDVEDDADDEDAASTTTSDALAASTDAEADAAEREIDTDRLGVDDTGMEPNGADEPSGEDDEEDDEQEADDGDEDDADLSDAAESETPGLEPVDALDAEDEDDVAAEPAPPPRRGWWQVSPSAPVSPLAPLAPLAPLDQASPMDRLSAETALTPPVDPIVAPPIEAADPLANATDADTADTPAAPAHPFSQGGDGLDDILDQILKQAGLPRDAVKSAPDRTPEKTDE